MENVATPPGLSCRIARADAVLALRDLPPDSVDMLLADPPYCSGAGTRTGRNRSAADKYQSAGSRMLADFPGDSRDERSFLLWSHLWMSEALRALRPGGSAVVFSDWRQLPNTADAMQVAGFTWQGVVVWRKPINARPQPNSFRSECEFALWFSRGPIDRTPSPSAKYLPGFYEVPAPHGDARLHATEKPTALLRGLMAIAPEGGTVLDPFMGSGSTGVACAETGRSFVGVEMTEHYYAVARARIAEAYARG